MKGNGNMFLLGRVPLPFQASVPNNILPRPIPFYDNVRGVTSQDGGVERRRIDEEEGGGRKE
jgi:hypothetical protein